MANIWRKDDNVKEQPKRNIMDLSFQNNLTTQFGKLVPVFCKEFIPGDSFSIKPTFSLKFQPMVFPIQTRMRAHLHFFKVRNRNLWKDWEDFIAKNKENLDPPYLDTAVTKPTTGSLLDYLGVPTTIYSTGYGSSAYEFELRGANGSRPFVVPASVMPRPYSTNTGWWPANIDYTYFIPYVLSRLSLLQTYNSGFSYNTIANLDSANLEGYYSLWYVDGDLNLLKDMSRLSLSVGTTESLGTDVNTYLSQTAISEQPELFDTVYDGSGTVNSRDENTSPRYKSFALVLFGEDGSPLQLLNTYQLSNQGKIDFDLSSLDTSLSFSKAVLLCQNFWQAVYVDESLDGKTFNFGLADNQTDLISLYATKLTYELNSDVNVPETPEVVDIDDYNSPYWRTTQLTDLRERIKLSALPCRAYEQIYNSFYRNAENNPYILNGVPEYNKYMPTDEGGVDANLYDFYYRNWEDDFLTTSLQQPQAGIAPLVGLTGTAGSATVTLADADGNTSEATAQYDEEGNVISVSFANNTSLTAALADAVTYGISINDLRNVNAFQRWLEAKARGGYKYRDVIETMFGISVRYDTLDMPEFIGGTSIDIMVNQISQTTPTETSPLGDYAGQAAGIGSGETINEYFDEHGFVIGILSVVPVPNYSQLLPKHFIKRDAFDYYFPQFGHIGMQPIKYNEVCPVQAYQESTEQSNVLDETFGYQRAWYDYLASTDEVHGEFRTNLRNFVMNRTFDVKPELVNDFLTVDPSQLNDVFAIQDDSYDKILGQIYFDVKAKRPIPLYGIPKLE